MMRRLKKLEDKGDKKWKLKELNLKTV
jgi:hypothetical protein